MGTPPDLALSCRSTSRALGTVTLWLWLVAFGCNGDLDFARGRGAFCDGPSACAAGLYCDLAEQRCTALRSFGDPCASPTQCDNGFCVHGVCCNGPCNASCLSCSLAGSVGICSTVPEGRDPHDHCPGTALCSDLGRCQGTPVWSHRFGGADAEQARAIAVGADGTIYVAGSFHGPFTMGGESFEAVGERDVFVAALDVEGVPIWTVTFGSTGDDEPTDLVVAANGSLLVSGSFEGPMDVLGEPLTASDRDAFLVTLAPDGSAAPVALSLSGTGLTTIEDIATTGAGPLFVTGSFDGELVVDGQAPITTAGERDAFVVAIDETGSPMWRRALGDAADQIGQAIAVTAGGEVILAVTGRGTVDSGGDAITGSVEDDDLFVVRLEAATGAGGSVLLFGGQGNQRARALAVDAGDELWLVGSFTREIIVPGGPTLVGGDDVDGFYTKLSETGAHLASLSLGGPFDDEPMGLTVDAEGNAIIAGRFELELFLGEEGSSLQASGGADLFLLKAGPDAGPSWSQPYGGPLADRAVAVATSADSDVLAVGDFEAELEFIAGDKLVAAGRTDLFVAKFAR